MIAQDPLTAKFDGMPRAAIDTGYIDAVLAPDAMPQVLEQYSHDPETTRQELSKVENSMFSQDPVSLIFALFRERYGLDFSFYKCSST